ncbi:MAG TPA: peptide chain release factor N(5)-glutamine methyltransferase [Gemmatimonadales bacterium]|nr:peptide chain release factor N(5)-glutamine methyltransferase [Gemmatimonadales bacterium]
MTGWVRVLHPVIPSSRHPVAHHVENAADRFAAAGFREPRRGAWRLWGAVAGVTAGEAWRTGHAPASPGLVEQFERAVARRLEGAPFAYAVGTAAFRTLELAVDRRVLIPRPETEGLVDRVLAWAGRRTRWGVAADIGTGSGCIALSLAVEGRFTRVLATDWSAEALAVARENARRVTPVTPVEFRAGDLLWPLRREQVDVLVSNPPYVTAAEWEALEPGVRDWEPRQALVAGPDGLRHTDALLRAAPSALRPGGLLAIEVDCGRAAATHALARALGWRDARLEEDLFGRPRYLLATREDA